jgi:hypothetical protein
MQLGEIYVWETEKAQGHAKRKKYHVFICHQDADGDHTFLYINTVDWYKDYKITKSNYSFLTYDSFIGCSAIVTYTDAELATAKPQLVGRLANDDMKGLRNAIIAAETMVQRDENRVCKALAAIL